jgi:hypothetical protein
VNPLSTSGFYYYDVATNKVQVVSLCSFAEDECGKPIPPTQLVGCSEDDTTATESPDFEALPVGALAYGVTWCPGDVGYRPAPLGTTFWSCPGQLVDVTSPTAGNTAATISAVTIASATGKPIPENATHVRIQARLCLKTSEEEVLKSAAMELGGQDAALVKVQHFAATGFNEVADTVSATVPLSAQSIPYTISADDGSTYVYKIWMEGYEVSPCTIIEPCV